jgi:hypothetical protein
MFHDAIPTNVNTPLMLIFRMWQPVRQLLFWVKCQVIHAVWKDVTIQLIDCRMHTDKNHSHCVDALMNQIETAFGWSIVVCKHSYRFYWHPIWCLYILLFNSRRVSNSFGLSLRIRVQIQTETLAKWYSRSSINRNLAIMYGSISNS